MGVSIMHLFKQGPVIKSLLKTAVSALKSNVHGKINAENPPSGAVLEQVLQPRNPRLVADYIEHVGGNPSWYKGILPPHFFPQWGFPLMASTLEGLPYNLSRILNGGCRIEILHSIPIDSTLHIKAQLVEVDDNGSRVILKQKLITGTEKHPESLISYVNAIVPLKSSGGPKKEKPSVPLNAHEIATWRISKTTGTEFALLTGGINPVHWIAGYAKISGFPNTIMHGFATFARTIESLNGSLWHGNVQRLKTFECRFLKPIVFPGKVKVFVDNRRHEVFIGHAPGGPAYLTGQITALQENDDE